MYPIRTGRASTRPQEAGMFRGRLPRARWLRPLLALSAAWLLLLPLQALRAADPVPQPAPGDNDQKPKLLPALPGPVGPATRILTVPEAPAGEGSQFSTPSGQPDITGPIDPQTGYILEHKDDAKLQPKLVALLAHRNPSVREKAAEALATNDSLPASVQAAVALRLLDSAVEVRRAAISVLSQQKSVAKDTIGQLIMALNDADVNVGNNAAAVLGRMGEGAGTAVPALVALISDPQRAETAIAALGEIGPPARWIVPQLLERLQDSEEVDAVTVTALVKLGANDAVKVQLLQRFQDSPHNTGIISALALIQPTSDPVIDALMAATHDQDENLRQNAMVALGQVRPSSERTVAALGAITKAKSVNDRASAVIALGEIEPKLPAAIPLLVAAMHDKEQPVRDAAYNSLGTFTLPIDIRLRVYLPMALDQFWGPSSLGWNDTATAQAQGLPALKAVIQNKDEDEILRAGAVMMAWQCEEDPHAQAKALSLKLLAEAATPLEIAAQAAVGLANDGEQKAPRVVEVLLAAAKDSRRGATRVAAALALGKLGNPAGVAALNKIMEEPDENIARKAILAIDQLPPEQAAGAVPTLCRIVKNRRSPLRSQAADALGSIRKPADVLVPVLVEALGSGLEDPELAASSLGNIVHDSPAEAPRVTAALVALLKSNQSDALHLALMALSHMPPEALAPVVPTIAERLKDQNEETRSAAINALRAAGPGAGKVVPELLKALKDPVNADMRTQIIETLGACQADPQLIVPAVLPYLDNEEFADAASGVLCHLGPGGKAAVPALTHLLQRPWASQRTAAAEGLSRIGSDAVGAVPDLVKVYRDDPDENVRNAAAAAILAIAPDQAKKLGVKLSEDARWEVPSASAAPPSAQPAPRLRIMDDPFK